MRSCLAILIAGLALAVPSNPAAADPAKSAAFGRTFMRGFTRCAVRLGRDHVKKYVLATGNDTLTRDELAGVFVRPCIEAEGPGAHLEMKGLQLKGMFAESLIARDHGSWPPINPAELRPIDWSVPEPKLVDPRSGKPLEPAVIKLVQALHELAVAQSKVGQLGECVVRASPAGAVTVLNTKMDDPAELSALKALTPVIASCIKAGEIASFNRTDLRSAIALSYYRLANADDHLGR